MDSSKPHQEIPPLSEVIKHFSFKDTVSLTDSLSLPEVLIVGARPLHPTLRPENELRVFHEIAKRKIQDLEVQRGRIYKCVMDDFFHGEKLAHKEVDNYLGKYWFILGPAISLQNLVENLEARVKTEMVAYRRWIQAYQNGRRDLANVKEMQRLEGTPANLAYHFHDHYNVKNPKEPHLVVAKTKARVRIASKIPYKMIEGYREREEGVIKGHEFKRYIHFGDGVTRDNVGLQFVTLDEITLYKLKGFIFQSDEIDVVPTRSGIFIEEYGTKGDIEYRAWHLDNRWNPKPVPVSAYYDPHANVVEVILIEARYFFSSNFGTNSYWRRMLDQEKGIVQQTFSNGMKRDHKPFTPQEKEWKRIVTDRILAILTYAKR
ncbi:MAG: hypothetical protein AABX33_04750 [Nanoarchaeota archaeon]